MWILKALSICFNLLFTGSIQAGIMQPDGAIPSDSKFNGEKYFARKTHFFVWYECERLTLNLLLHSLSLM